MMGLGKPVWQKRVESILPRRPLIRVTPGHPPRCHLTQFQPLPLPLLLSHVVPSRPPPQTPAPEGRVNTLLLRARDPPPPPSAAGGRRPPPIPMLSMTARERQRYALHAVARGTGAKGEGGVGYAFRNRQVGDTPPSRPP